MPTINVSGAGGTPSENNQPQQTPEQKLADAVSAGKKLQRSSRDIADFFGSLGESTRRAFDEAARKQQEEENKLRASQTAQQRREQQAADQQARKDRQSQQYLQRVRATSMRWEDQAKAKDARDAKNAADKAARKAEADEAYLRRVRQTSMQWIERDKKKGEQQRVQEEKRQARDAERAEQQAQAAKSARMRNTARFARTTAMVVSGIHGDIEGVSAGVGAGLGALLGGGPGAEIGEVLGEVAAKIGKAIITAPLALGNMWDGYMSMSQPYFTPQRQAADLGGAGGFQGDDLFSSIRRPGQFQAQSWMSYYGRGQSEVLQMLADTGIVPRNAGEGTGLIQNMLATGYTPGFRGLGDGAVTSTLGQGLSAGLTSPSGALKYLSQFGQVLQKGVPLDIDRSKLLNRMTDAIEMMVKSGSQVVSEGSLTDMFARFMMAGGPGRGGDAAAASIAGTTGVLNNLTGSTGTLYNFQRVAGRFNNFKSEDDIKNALGPEGWAKLQQMPARDEIIRQITGSSGNIYAQSGLMGTLFDPKRYQDLTNDLNSNIGGAVGNAVSAGATGQTPIQNLLGQFGRKQGAIGQSLMFSGQHHAGPTAEQAALAQKVASGTASDDETRQLLAGYGVPADQIPMMIAEGKRQGINPMNFAIAAFHESEFQPHVRDQKNIMKSGRLNTDRGFFQISDQHDPEDPLQLDRYSLDYQYRKEGQVLTGYGKGAADLRRANPLDRNWNGFVDSQAGWLADAGNRPVENQYKANADSAKVEGAKTESEMLGGSMIKLTTTVDDAAAAVKRFIAALNNYGGAGDIPGAPQDMASRLGRNAARGGEAWTNMGALGAMP